MQRWYPNYENPKCRHILDITSSIYIYIYIHNVDTTSRINMHIYMWIQWPKSGHFEESFTRLDFRSQNRVLVLTMSTI